MLSGQLRSAVIILIVTALTLSAAQAQVAPPCRPPAGGISTERLSPKHLALWRRIERFVFAADGEGRLLHPVLHSLWERVGTSGHTIYLEISESPLSSTAGLFRLEKYDPTGRNHTAVIELRPFAIDQAYVGPIAQRPDGLIPFEGLAKEERYAEVLGHELAHANEVLMTPGLALQVEEHIHQTNELLLSPRRRRELKFYAGSEMGRRIENRDLLLQRLETHAEMMEALVWRELLATKQLRKGM